MLKSAIFCLFALFGLFSVAPTLENFLPTPLCRPTTQFLCPTEQATPQVVIMGHMHQPLIQPWSRINVTSGLNICKMVKKT